MTAKGVELFEPNLVEGCSVAVNLTQGDCREMLVGDDYVFVERDLADSVVSVNRLLGEITAGESVAEVERVVA